MQRNITLLSTEIRTDLEGRFRLNDLHKAAGGEKRHNPSYWLSNQQTAELIEVLTGDPQTTGNPVVSAEGRNGGTYVCKELVYAYAMWVSPRFHLHVVRTFDEVATGQRQQQSAEPPKPTSKLAGELALLECAARVLNASESGKLVMLQKVGTQHGLDTGFLPGYAVDAAPDAAGGSSMPTKSLTELLKERGIKYAPAAINRMLESHGYLRHLHRRNTKGEAVKFWSVTEKGLDYGKNITSPQSPRETQPHWYVDRFGELLGKIGVIACGVAV